MIYDTEYILGKVNETNKETKSWTSENELVRFLSSNPVHLEDIVSAFSDLRLKFGEHMKLDHVLFFFGNGASIYAGSKDTRKFSLYNYLNEDSFATIRDVIEKVSKLKGVEEQLNALITIHTSFNVMGDDKKTKVASLIDEIKKDLITSFVNSIDYRSLYLHDIFFLKLRSYGCLSRTNIYTPNYDLAFEYALDKLGIAYTDGFSGFINRRFDSRELVDKDKMALIKIHGSVNWTVEDKTIKEFQPKFNAGKVKIEDTMPVLIYPTSSKFYQTYATPYSELMRHMLNKMETGNNTIVVLGYKYGDDHINDILFKALENPGNIFYFFLYDLDEKNGFIEDIINLADSMPNINILTGKVLASFETFVKYLLPATPEKTDHEKAIELLQKVLVDHES